MNCGSNLIWAVVDWFCRTERRKAWLVELTLATPALLLAAASALARP